MPHFTPRRLQSGFTYHIGAAASAKRTPPRQAKHNVDFWTYASTNSNPSPPYVRSTKPDSGEDAFFMTTVGGSPHHVAFGVADGVGGWQDQGVDPSEFSHGLCGLMAGTAYLHESNAKVEEKNESPAQGELSVALRPQSLLQTAYDAVMSNPRIMAGGCTASLAVMSAEGDMETANLGDSGYLIFQPGKVAYRSDIQTHAFNTPYQLSKVPPQILKQQSIFGGAGGKHFSEVPSQAEVQQHKMRHGDIVVFATDGVWDNLSASDCLGIVMKMMKDTGYWVQEPKSAGAETILNSSQITALPSTFSKHDEYLPAVLATAIMREAKVAGLDNRRNGPFAKEVNFHYPSEGWRGGKADDIAVVVCVAVDGSAVPDPKVDEKPIKAKL